MSAAKKGGTLVGVLLALGLGTAREASAQPGLVFRFEALIEGKSRLIVRGNTVQWLDLEGVPPGREGGRNEPTLANGVPWLPSWPDVPDAENRDCGCLSDVFTGLNPPLPLMALNPTMRIVRARNDIFGVQGPHPSNNFTLVLEFDDTRSPGADTYIVELDLTPQHDFAAFPAEATVRFGLQNAADQGQVPPINDIDLRATFTLASDSEGIDPVREPVTIGLGVFRVFIPAGSFRRTSSGRFDFQGEIFGVALRVTIIQRGPGTFEFTAGISGGTVNGSGIPLSVDVSVGNDRGFNVLFEGEMTARTPQP